MKSISVVSIFTIQLALVCLINSKDGKYVHVRYERIRSTSN